MMNNCAWTAALAVAAGSASATVTTTFDAGTEGWSVSGRDTIAPTGNPGNGLDVELLDVFGADIRNNTNGDFLGDLTRYGSSIAFSVDIKINSLDFFGQQVSRDLIVEVRDYDNPNGYPWTSVWVNLGTISAAATGEWTTFSVVIDDTASMALPAGWGGYGDEDPVTFEPILPAGRTFTSVLQSVDELAFTTFVPGFFFGFTNFDMQVDNISIITVPSPAAVSVLAMGGLVAGRRRRG